MPATPIHRFSNTPSNPFGPAPSPTEPHLTRPKSSSSLPYARPSNPTSSNAGGASASASALQSHPIMVALSGWPEPVYVAESKEVARRRSRAGTPVLQPLTTGMSDGVDLSMLPPLNGASKPPVPTQSYESSSNRYREEHSPYPVSSTRSTRTSPVNSGPSSPTVPHHSYPHPPLPRGYHDPRYAPNATLHDRALKVVPAWSSAASGRTAEDAGGSVGVGMRVPAGQRGEAVLVMRAVPDVYPPPTPGRVMAGAGGVAKEVYPRDPNNAFLWNGAGPGTGPGAAAGAGGGTGGATPTGASVMSPTRLVEAKEER